MRMRNVLPATLAFSLLLFVPFVSSAQADVDPLVKMAGNDAPLAHSVRTGDMSPDRPITAALAMKLHDETQLELFLADLQDPASPRYHHFLTPAQFAESFAPTADEVAKVVTFLKKSGATGISVSENRQTITFQGSAGKLASTFHTPLGNYTDMTSGRPFYANDIEPALPTSIASLVSGVIGLDDHAVRKSHARVSQGIAAPVTPPILRQAYQVNGLNATGRGVRVGLVEFAGFQQSDITTFDRTFGLSAPPVTTVPVNGVNLNSQGGDGEIEAELDIEVVHALAPAAENLVYEADNSPAGELAMYQKIAADQDVDVVSISWGACESEEGKAQASAVNSALETGTAEGISYLVAAGDDGAADCFRQNGSNARAVDFPASSPAVTAVGGTKLSVTSGGGYAGEVVWNDGNAGGATGGGVSTLFKAPSNQGSSGGRSVPDVAADAAPSTGYRIFSQGQWTTVGGTSGAAPLWASFVALQNEVHGWQLGNLNPALYRVGTSAGFNDVTSGDNSHEGAKGFKARRGFDQATGWGSFRGAALSKLLG